MKCPKCQAEGKLIRKSPHIWLDDTFRCNCTFNLFPYKSQVYSRSQSIMAEEERMDAAFQEAMAMEESNRSQEIDLDADDIGDDPILNGWVGSNGLP